MLDYLKAAGRFTLRHWPTTIFVGGILLLAMTTNILERFFVYYPMKEIFADPSRFGLQFDDVRAVTEDGVKVHGWFVSKPGARFTFLIFHGNAGNISHRLGWIQMLHELDANVMIIDYRGYGLSEGKPFEKGLYLDALAAYSWWARERTTDQSTLILVGESRGGAVAIDLASRVQVDGIVLQSTFTTAWDMAKTIIPVGLLQPLTGVRFDSAAKVRANRCPKLFIHGNRDEIVPIRLMGTRTGALDPGVVLYLMDELGMDARAIENLLYRQSGLLGVSGVSSDMRTLLASDDPRAAFAIELFCYRAQRELGSLAAALGGLDALVFPGGIGEHAAPIRAGIMRGTEWLGLELDPAANAAHRTCITTPDSDVPAYVIPTNEELMIARDTRAVVGA